MFEQPMCLFAYIEMLKMPARNFISTIRTRERVYMCFVSTSIALPPLLLSVSLFEHNNQAKIETFYLSPPLHAPHISIENLYINNQHINRHFFLCLFFSAVVVVLLVVLVCAIFRARNLILKGLMAMAGGRERERVKDISYSLQSIAMCLTSSGKA